jgi:hypothetical protein
MFMRNSIILLGALSVLSFAACETARDQQEKANEAQAEADQKVAEANRDANAKTNEAQAEADKKIADAQATFAKMREDYRHDVNAKLVDLDKKIADLEAKVKTETSAQKRTELEAKLTDIRASRDSFATEYRSVETASASTWDDVKKRIDKSLNDLESKINRA